MEKTCTDPCSKTILLDAPSGNQPADFTAISDVTTSSSTFPEFVDTLTRVCPLMDCQTSTYSLSCFDCAGCDDGIAGCSVNCPAPTEPTFPYSIDEPSPFLRAVSVTPTSADESTHRCWIKGNHPDSLTTATTTDPFELVVASACLTTFCASTTLLPLDLTTATVPQDLTILLDE